MAMTALPIQPLPVCVALLKGRLRHGCCTECSTVCWPLSCLPFRSRSPHIAKHFTSNEFLLIIYMHTLLGEREPAHLVVQHVQTALFFYNYIYIIIYIRVVRIRRALNLLRASFSPIFQYFSAVNVTRVSFSPVFQYFVTYAMRHGIVLSASSTLNSSAMYSSTMDSSAIGVGVAVYVGKCMQGPCSAVPDIRSIR